MEAGHPDSNPACATRRALLDAAAAEFSERGFREATVRGICRRARANVAAVKYHFGDKTGLYRAVLAWTGERAAGSVPEAPGPPESRLGEMVSAMLRTLTGQGPGSWYGSLMAREMVEPTGALDEVVERFIRPQARRMEAVVRELGGGRLGTAEVRRCALSVVAQVLFYRHCRPVLERLHPGTVPGARGHRTLADHITRFSIDAIRAAAARRPAPR